MKTIAKILLVLLCSLVFSGAFGQGGFVPVYVIPDLSTYFKTAVPAGSLVYVQSTDRFYNVLVACGRAVNMTWVLADGSRYDDATIASLGSTCTVTDSLIVPVVDATTKVLIKSQSITQNHVNNALFNNSATATDTLFAPVIDATTRALIKSQILSQDNTNRLDLNNSLQVNDTLFIGSTQYVLQTTINRIKSEGSIQATDTVFGGVVNATGYAQAGGFVCMSDTIVTAPLYTIAKANGHVYVKISLTGISSDRWKQIDN